MANTVHTDRHSLKEHIQLINPAPVAKSVECLLRGRGGHGFDPGPRHTKVIKMVLASPPLTLGLTW